MLTLDKIQINRKILEGDLKKLYVKETDVLLGQIFACSNCSKCSKLKDIENIYWMEVYVEPHGCEGGDYWTGADEIRVVCPKCSKIERFYNSKSFSKNSLLKELNSDFGLFLRLFKDIYKIASVGGWPEYKFTIH